MKLTGRGVLGLPEDATHDEVKKAYRRLAKLMHPDVNGSEAATEMMRIVNLAQETALAAEVEKTYTPKHVDEDPCAVVLTFGKYEGKCVGDVVSDKPWYVFWLLETFDENGRWWKRFDAAIQHVYDLEHGWEAGDAARLERSFEAWEKRK